jgi:Protein of unknown function (DUF4236)
MGYFRFQRRIGIGSFGRINISKRSVSLSEGVRGAHVTIGKTPRITLGLPGSGLSWTQTFRSHARRAASSARQPFFLPRWLVLAILAMFIAAAIWG